MCRKVLISLLIVMFVLSGCGQSGNALGETVDTGFTETGDAAQGDEETDAGSAETEDKAETGDSEPSEELPKPVEVPVNTTPEEILYYSGDDGDDVPPPDYAKYCCVSDGENIYLAYSRQDLYVMPIGADRHSRANIDNPEGMNICKAALDIYGRLHLLVADSDYEEWFIWRLDESLQTDRVIDISAYYETQRPPVWFLVDKDGTYYLQGVFKDGIIVDSEGALMHSFTPKSLGSGWPYAAAAGKDGRIYLVHSDLDEKVVIDGLDVENGTIKKEDSPLWFPGSEIFTLASAGTDTDLLLFSPYSGVWAYDREKGILENRVPISDMSSGSGMDLCPLTFLPDGRLLLVERSKNDIYLKYIPAGR